MNIMFEGKSYSSALLAAYLITAFYFQNSDLLNINLLNIILVKLT